MTDPKETKAEGTFWLPNATDIALTGTLSYTVNLPDVQPMVQVNGEICKENGLVQIIPFVHGAVPEGEITLYNSMLAGSSIGYGHHSQLLKPEFVFIGNKHYCDVGDLLFDQARFSLYNATFWFDKSGFRRNKEKPYTITFIPPSKIEFNLNSECSAYVEFRLYQDDLNYLSRFEAREYQYCKICFKYDTLNPFQRILEDIVTFTQFVTFCAIQQTYAPNISLFKTESKEEVRILRYDKLKIKQTKHLEGKRTPNYNLIPFESIETKFLDLVVKWFDDHRNIKIKPVLTLVLRIIRERPTLNVITFLDSTRALEVFHKNVLDRHRESTETFKPKLDRLLAKMDSNEQQLFGCVKGANNKDLKERIIDLVSDYLKSDERVVNELTSWNHGTSDPILLNVTTVEQLAKLVTDTRNFHTHYDERYEGKIIELDNSVMQATGKTVELLILCLMQYYGVADIPRALRVFGVW